MRNDHRWLCNCHNLPDGGLCHACDDPTIDDTDEEEQEDDDE